MARRKTGPVPRSSGRGFFKLPRELFEDEPTRAATQQGARASPEETYQDSLNAGLPRDADVEKTLDMSKITLP